MYRQGDVLIIGTNEAITGAEMERDNGRLVLAYGEVTGHAHAITERDVSLYAVGDDGRLLQCDEQAVLRHEEHDPVTIPRGTYRVYQQREYTPQGIKRVLD